MMDIAAQLAKDFGMKECWINAYYYAAIDKTFYGDLKFITELEAIRYFPSFGLKVAYRIHVRMK